MALIGDLLVGLAFTVAFGYLVAWLLPVKPPSWFYGDDEDR